MKVICVIVIRIIINSLTVITTSDADTHDQTMYLFINCRNNVLANKRFKLFKFSRKI